MTAEVRLSRSYRIEIPKALRDSHSWRPGQTFVLVPKGRSVLLVPAPSLADLKGIGKGADTSDYRDRTDRF